MSKENWQEKISKIVREHIKDANVKCVIEDRRKITIYEFFDNVSDVFEEDKDLEILEPKKARSVSRRLGKRRPKRRIDNCDDKPTRFVKHLESEPVPEAEQDPEQTPKKRRGGRPRLNIEVKEGEKRRSKVNELYLKNRYATDTEFREKMKQKAKENYQKLKRKKSGLDENCNACMREGIVCSDHCVNCKIAQESEYPHFCGNHD